jgi:polyisoprenoid-binding protein YceI
MTNYLFAFSAIAVLTAATAVAATPAPAAAPAKPAAALPHYVQAPSGSKLTFSFEQAGAENQGEFKRFATEFDYDERNLAGSSLRVTVQTGSLDTQDKDRDDSITGPDLLDTKKFPTAKFVANTLVKGAKGIEAVGKLTLHGATKDLRVPLTIKTTTTGVEIAGVAVIKRLDYGIGQGDFRTTEWAGDEVKLQYQVALTKAK